MKDPQPTQEIDTWAIALEIKDQARCMGYVEDIQAIVDKALTQQRQKLLDVSYASTAAALAKLDEEHADEICRRAQSLSDAGIELVTERLEAKIRAAKTMTACPCKQIILDAIAEDL